MLPSIVEAEWSGQSIAVVRQLAQLETVSKL